MSSDICPGCGEKLHLIDMFTGNRFCKTPFPYCYFKMEDNQYTPYWCAGYEKWLEAKAIERGNGIIHTRECLLSRIYQQ